MQILDAGMDNNMTICGQLKNTVLSFCKENYEYPDIDIDGIICVSFKNSFQQHVVHIHDKVVKGRDKDVSATVIGQNSQNVLKETANDLLFKNSENCCYACIKEREDSSNIKHKKFSSKQSKGVINFTTKKGPPPLYNSKTLCFSDNSRSFGNDIHVSRFKSSKLHQNRRKLQTKINQPLKNISCNQNENYTSSEVCKPVGGNSSVLEEHYQQEMYRGTVSQDMLEESEPTNQMVENKISRAVCIENDEISKRDKVVVKLELMDSENEEDFRGAINGDESEKVSHLNLNEREKYLDEMGEFCKDRDIQKNAVEDNTENENSEEYDNESQSESTNIYQGENSKVYHHENTEVYEDEDVKFDIDNLAHHINSQSETLQSALVSTGLVLKDIKCITTNDDCMQLVNTATGDQDFFHSNHDNWESYNTVAENTMMDESYSMNMNSDTPTTGPHADCPGSNHQSVDNQIMPATDRSGVFQNHQSSGYRENFPNKFYNKRFLPLQRLRQFGNMKTNMSSSILMPFRKSKMLLKTESVSSSQDQFAKEKKYHCKHCGMGFTTTGNKTRHERTTCGKSVYKCDFCQAFFSRSDSKARHMLVRHGVSVSG